MQAPAAHDPLVRALRDPPATSAFALHEWDDALWRARAHGLLARLACALVDCASFDRAPAKARAQMRAALVASESTQTAVRFELNRVLRALDDEHAVVLLKGAAYMMAELPCARGRLIGDLDLLVPRARLADVERALVAAGWRAGPITDYDERYYREQAHEIPPLQHPDRDTPVDVHHTIAPPGARAHPDADALVAASVPLADPRLRVLSPADMVLHGAYHLFSDEVAHPLRDLFDLHDLLGRFGDQPSFWDTLVARARLHGLGRPLHYALRHSSRLLGTSVPAQAIAASAAFAPAAPVEAVMDALFVRRFGSRLIDGARPARTLAGGAYYLRAHWLRMPPAALARHLATKAVARIRARQQAR
jgi:hypothetical protein